MAGPVHVPKPACERPGHAGADRLAVDDGHGHDPARGRAEQDLIGPAQVRSAQPALLGPMAGAEQVFGNGAKVAAVDAEAVQAELYEQIGRLKMELEWLKKKVTAFA